MPFNETSATDCNKLQQTATNCNALDLGRGCKWPFNEPQWFSGNSPHLCLQGATQPNVPIAPQFCPTSLDTTQLYLPHPYCAHTSATHPNFAHTYGVATVSMLLKIMVSFADYRLFYRALLQKRPIILRSLLIVATPPHTQNFTPTLPIQCLMS